MVSRKNSQATGKQAILILTGIAVIALMIIFILSAIKVYGH
jgi:hypothetical protein